MTLTAFDLPGGIVTTRPAAPDWFDRLTVDHPGRRARFATRRFGRLQQQLKIDALKHAVISPIVEITLAPL
jgi:hypothetical protein